MQKRVSISCDCPTVKKLTDISIITQGGPRRTKADQGGPRRTKADQGGPRRTKADHGNFNSQLNLYSKDTVIKSPLKIVFCFLDYVQPYIYNILCIIYYVNKNNAKIKLFSSGTGRTRADQGGPRITQGDTGGPGQF